MTRAEYIRQLPGVKEKEKYGLSCPDKYGLDHEVCTFSSFCDQCYDHEATIGGEPAPYIFLAPVKPGQTLYRVSNPIITAFRVHTVRFYEHGWKAYTEEKDGRTLFITDDDDWMKRVFPTREAAEAKLSEMRSRGGCAKARHFVPRSSCPERGRVTDSDDTNCGQIHRREWTPNNGFNDYDDEE